MSRAAYFREWRINNRERLAPIRRAREQAMWNYRRAELLQKRSDKRAAVKVKAFACLGGKCNCCGEHRQAFLQIDHINNDGAKYRKKFGGPTQTSNGRPRWGTKQQNDLYKSIICGIANDIQLLCASCNWGKARNNGVCPHVEERMAEAILVA